MSFLLIAAEPSRTVVVERGGTQWWIPLVTTLAVAVLAAGASYYATWRFKMADVNRESAFRAADLVNQAEQIASLPGRRGAQAEQDVGDANFRLQGARIRAQPLGDDDLDDRFKAAGSYVYELLQSWGGDPSGRAQHWLREAIANVRAGIVPHLSAPKLVGQPQAPERSFPTSEELSAMPTDVRDGNVLVDALADWRANRA